jgi:N-methylhydantoinase B
MIADTPATPTRRSLALRLELEEAAATMDRTLRRAAGSASIARHGNSAAGVYAPTGALLVGGREAHPLLLEAAAEALTHLIAGREAFPSPFEPDDLYATNDPGCNAAGLEDLVLAMPIVRVGRLVGFVALTATHPGLGRATLAPAERLRREGLVLPWLRLGQGGRLQDEALRLLAANTDDPDAFREDLAAQRHALGLGRDALEDLLERQGTEALVELGEVIAAGARRALAQTLRRLEIEEIVGRVAGLEVRIRRADPPVPVRLVCLEGDAPLTPALARAAIRAAFRELLGTESPGLAVLGGLAEALAIEVDLIPAAARPMGEARFAGAQTALEAVLAAFAGSLPHLAHAPDAAPLLLDLHGRRDDGTRYRMRLGLPGGLGASVYGDGLSHAAAPFSPFRTHAVETLERALPLRVHAVELVPDSGGPGQYRGGLAARVTLELLAGQAEADILVPGRTTGMQGGMRGAQARIQHITLRRGTRDVEGPTRVTIPLEPGDRLVLESGGGAGWGIPFQRSIMRLEEDLARGYLTPHQSRNRYGLVLQPGTLIKDDHLTYRVRHYLLSTLAVDDIIAGEELLD